MTATDHPIHLDNRGRTASIERSGYLRDLVAQVLFTAPGERVMRNTFGAGVSQLLFEPGGTQIAATAQLLIQSSLQQWLGDIIDIRQVEVVSEDSTLSVLVVFAERRTGIELTERYDVPGGSS